MQNSNSDKGLKFNSKRDKNVLENHGGTFDTAKIRKKIKKLPEAMPEVGYMDSSKTDHKNLNWYREFLKIQNEPTAKGKAKLIANNSNIEFQTQNKKGGSSERVPKDFIKNFKMVDGQPRKLDQNKSHGAIVASPTSQANNIRMGNNFFQHNGRSPPKEQMRSSGSSEHSNRERLNHGQAGNFMTPKGPHDQLEKNRKKLKKIAIMNKPMNHITKNGFKNTVLINQYDFLNSPSSINVLDINSEPNASEFQM
jgi:hypothetical protein